MWDWVCGVVVRFTQSPRPDADRPTADVWLCRKLSDVRIAEYTTAQFSAAVYVPFFISLALPSFARSGSAVCE